MVENKKPANEPAAKDDNRTVEEMLDIIRSRRQPAEYEMLEIIRSRRKAEQSEMTATSKPTGEQALLREGFFTANQVSGEWKFASNTEPKKRGEYSIAVSDLIKSPESLCDWLAHISEKNWFDPVKFFAFFRRYRPIP